MGVPSRSNGTPSIERTFPDRDLFANSGSEIGLGINDVADLPSSTTRPTIDPRPGLSGSRSMCSLCCCSGRTSQPRGRDYPSPSNRGLCAAQACGRFDQCIEDRFQIEGRPADDLQHLGGGGLLLQRLP